MFHKSAMWNRVLVTGGTGFLGKHLVRYLRQNYLANHVEVLPSSQVFDLTRQDLVSTSFHERKWFDRWFDKVPEVIFHLAARVGGIGANQTNPGLYFYQNLQMGLNVLESTRENLPNTKVVIAGTVCSYPKFTLAPFKEEDFWAGYPDESNAPYGVAKKALLVMAQAYRQQYGCNFVMPILANLYGPGDNFDLQTSHVIPGMIAKFAEAKANNLPEVVLWGDGSPTREFLYVEDAARGLVTVAQGYDAPEPINLGTGQEVSMKDLADMIAFMVGFQGTIVWDISRPNGQPKRHLDVSRAEQLLGFKSQVTLQSGLQSTLDYYLNCLQPQTK